MDPPNNDEGPVIRPGHRRLTLCEPCPRFATAESSSLEVALVGAALDWLAHGLAGDIPLDEALAAAQLLLDRAAQLFSEAA